MSSYELYVMGYNIIANVLSYKQEWLTSSRFFKPIGASNLSAITF